MGGQGVAPEHRAMQLGGRLRTARQRAGWTLEEAGTATAIPPAYLDALEEGRLDLLPGPVYTRGYVRTYATVLHLDGDSFTYAFCQLDPGGRFDDLAPAERSPRRRFNFAPGRWARVVIIGVCVLVGLIALDALWAAIGPTGDDNGSAIQRPASSAHGPQPATPAPAGPQPVPQPGPAPALAPTSSDAEGALYSVGRPTFVVTVDPRGRSWLQVRDGPEGDVRFEGTLEPGEVQSLPAEGALWVRVGDQGNVGVRVDDTPLALPGTPGEPYNLDVRTSPPEPGSR